MFSTGRLQLDVARALIGLAFASLLALAGCQNTTSPSATQSPSPPDEQRHFDLAQVPALALSESDLPAGLVLGAGYPKTNTIDNIPAESQQTLRSYGYDQIMSWYFTQPGLTQTPADWQPGFALVAHNVSHFADSKGADAYLKNTSKTVADNAVGAERLEVGRLGENALGLKGAMFRVEGEEDVTHYWNVGNLSFFIRIGGRSGTLDVEEVEKVVDAANRKATGR